MSSNGYPFVSTRRWVMQRLGSEPAFALECVAILAERNAFMASHRVRAARLLARLAAGSPTTEDIEEVAKLASRYGKTLARILREREVLTPEVAARAAVFGVVQPQSRATPAAEAVSSPGTASADGLADAPTATKRRGRPKGSKNRTSSVIESKRRTRS
jgi:crotonobetainyl-CoA:carnitine CoA-transferase CaiB-like acyl-CoA transferase